MIHRDTGESAVSAGRRVSSSRTKPSRALSHHEWGASMKHANQPTDPEVLFTRSESGELTLLINEHQAMQAWEEPLMKRSAQILCEGVQGTFLDGLGFAMSAVEIASQLRAIMKYLVMAFAFAELCGAVLAGQETRDGGSDAAEFRVCGRDRGHAWRYNQRPWGVRRNRSVRSMSGGPGARPGCGQSMYDSAFPPQRADCRSRARVSTPSRAAPRRLVVGRVFVPCRTAH